MATETPDDYTPPALTLTYTITQEVAHQLLVDLLVTAAEGGSNYWASFSRAPGEAHDYTAVTLTEHDAHGDAPPLVRRVDAADLLAGLQALTVAKFPSAAQHLRDALAEDGDAITADVVLQLAVFGDLIYG